MSGAPQVQRPQKQGLNITGSNIKFKADPAPKPPEQSPEPPAPAPPAPAPAPEPVKTSGSPISIVRPGPSGKNPIVERRKAGTAPTLIQRAFTYSWDDAIQILAEKTYPFKDEEMIQKHRNIIRAFLPSTLVKQPRPDGNDPKALSMQITKGLNQLTKDTYWDVMDRLTPRSHIVNSNYLKLLVSRIWEQARDHLAYATLYAEFLVAVKWELEQNAGEEQQKVYSAEILEHVHKFLSTVKDEHKSEESWSLFAGYLGRKQFLELAALRDTIKRLLSEPVQDEDLENAGRMIILCGKVMEEKYPTDVAEIFANFHTFSMAKGRFTGRARYFLRDIENARSDNWNEKEIQRILNLLPRDGQNPKKEPKTDTGIEVSKNRFADLLDEEDYIDDEFVDWEGAVRQYVIDRDVPEIGSVNKEEATELLFAIACSQPRDSAAALELLSVLQ